MVKVQVNQEESKVTFQSEPKIRLNNSTGAIRDGERAAWLLNLLNMPNPDIELFYKMYFLNIFGGDLFQLKLHNNYIPPFKQIRNTDRINTKTYKLW